MPRLDLEEASDYALPAIEFTHCMPQAALFEDSEFEDSEFEDSECARHGFETMHWSTGA
jgi:hypothetical protein